jgi:hypothetical protein
MPWSGAVDTLQAGAREQRMIAKMFLMSNESLSKREAVREAAEFA